VAADRSPGLSSFNQPSHSTFFKKVGQWFLMIKTFIGITVAATAAEFHGASLESTSQEYYIKKSCTVKEKQ
jgi:hypothetical protein